MSQILKRFAQYRSMDEPLRPPEVMGKFLAATLSVGGTFYLPYRHHYTPEDMERAYPGPRAGWWVGCVLGPGCSYRVRRVGRLVIP